VFGNDGKKKKIQTPLLLAKTRKTGKNRRRAKQKKYIGRGWREKGIGGEHEAKQGRLIGGNLKGGQGT